MGKEKSERMAISAQRTIWDLAWSAVSISFYGFAGLGGGLFALMPKTFLGLAEKVVCAGSTPAELMESTWGNTSEFLIFCGEKDRTLAGIAVILGSFFITIFWVVFVVLMVRREVIRKRLSGEG